MFFANYKATLKSIFRSPVTLLAFGATVILAISVYDLGAFPIDGVQTNMKILRENIWLHIRTTCCNLFPPFVGMMISANLLLEMQNGVGDLLVSSRKSILSIYLSKLFAVGTVTLVARMVVFSTVLLWFWLLHYPEIYVPNGTVLPFGKVLIHYTINEIVYMPLMLIGYTAMPVFVVAATEIPTSGAVWNVGYYLVSVLWGAFASSVFYLPPFSMDGYIAAFNYIDTPQYMADYLAGVLPDQTIFVPPFSHALTAYIGWIVFSVALLTAAYFILKKRYRT